ncbi:MAG TPA: hypothetical protein VMF65_18500, partial [Acidimicrobiales bacterium]|nr:hypothetical protein [Acidimicrobiales bacterium]
MDGISAVGAYRRTAVARWSSAARGRAGRRRTPEGRVRALLAVVTALCLAASAAMTAGASTGAAAAPLASAAPLGQDLSGTLPNVNYSQAVGDFTGVGHDELAYVENDQLKIADVRKSAGDVVRSTPTDLRATPNDGLVEPSTLSPYPEYEDLWQLSNQREFVDISKTFGLTSVKVAASASHIYMAGATWDSHAAQPAPTYAVHLYTLPHNGSCAEA